MITYFMFLGRTLNKELLVGLAKAVSVDMAFEVKKKKSFRCGSLHCMMARFLFVVLSERSE